MLHRGHIVQRGTHAELMQEGELYRRPASCQFREPSGTQEGLVKLIRPVPPCLQGVLRRLIHQKGLNPLRERRDRRAHLPRHGGI